MSGLYEDFANYILCEFMESMCLGQSGGLYGEEIEPNEGDFGKEEIKTFMRFQHGDRDYSRNFSDREEEKILDNIDEVAEIMLELIEEDWYGKDHYTGEFPDLMENARESLQQLTESENGGN